MPLQEKKINSLISPNDITLENYSLVKSFILVAQTNPYILKNSVFLFLFALLLFYNNLKKSSQIQTYVHALKNETSKEHYAKTGKTLLSTT